MDLSIYVLYVLIGATWATNLEGLIIGVDS